MRRELRKCVFCYRNSENYLRTIFIKGIDRIPLIFYFGKVQDSSDRKIEMSLKYEIFIGVYLFTFYLIFVLLKIEWINYIFIVDCNLLSQ